MSGLQLINEQRDGVLVFRADDSNDFMPSLPRDSQVVVLLGSSTYDFDLDDAVRSIEFRFANDAELVLRHASRIPSICFRGIDDEGEFLDGDHGVARLTLHIEDTKTIGHLEIVGAHVNVTSELRVSALGLDSCTLETRVQRSEATITAGFRGSVIWKGLDVTLRDSAVVSEGCRLRLSTTVSCYIEQLDVHLGGTVWLTDLDGETSANVVTVAGQREDDESAAIGGQAAGQVWLDTANPVQVGTIEQLAVRQTSTAAGGLVVTDRAVLVELGGFVTGQINPQGDFWEYETVPLILRLADRARVLGATGVAAVVAGEGCTLEGPVEITSWTGGHHAIIRHALLSDPHDSLRILDNMRLGEVSVFEPDLRWLRRVTATKKGWRWARKRWIELIEPFDDSTTDDSSSSRQSRDGGIALDFRDSEHRRWAFELAELCAQRGTSGRVRAETQFLAHEARRFAVSSQGRSLEGLLLSVGALFGYGCRALRPLLIWIIATVVVMLIAAIDHPYHFALGLVPARHALNLAAETLFLPSGWLQVAPGSDNSAILLKGAALRGARLAVSIPFAFLVFALVRIAHFQLRD